MRKYFILTVFSLSFGLTGLSQEYIAKLNSDSLKKVLLVAKDTQRANTLNLLARQILFSSEDRILADTAARLIREALALSKQLQYGKGLGNALLNKVTLDIRNTNNYPEYPAMLSAVETALPLLKQTGDWFSVAGCYDMTGECHHFLGDNNKAIQFFDSSVRLFQQLKDTISSVWIMVNQAHSHFDLGNFTMAYKIFHTVEEITPKTDTILQCYTGCNIAALFLGAGLPEIAIEYMNKIRAYHKIFTVEQRKNWRWSLLWVTRIGGEAFLQLKQVDSALKIAAFLNLTIDEQDAPDNLFYGNLYSATGDYQKALIYYKRGYKLSQHASYEIGHANHANGLATAYLQLKDFSKAINYAHEAVRVSKKMHALLQEKDAVETLSKVYAAIKNYPKAYYYNQLYKSLNDSVVPEEYRRKLSLIQIKNQLELQKQQAQLLSAQNQMNQQQLRLQESSLKRRSLLLYIIFAALLIMALMTILVIRNIKLKKRKQELQQLMEQVNAQQKLTELEKEKANLEMQALRAQMNPHFIFNCLSSINRFILINKIEEASDYLTKFSRLIRMALHNSEKPLITLESDLEALRLYLDLERLRFKNAFNYSITFINTIDIEAVYIPPMLIQPFAENAIWHGLMHKKGIGRLDIQLFIEGRILTCAIIDNGIGRNTAATLKSRSAVKNKSMGVEITAGRLALLNKSKNEAAIFNIEDLVDEEGNGCGTKVVVSMHYKDLSEVV